MSKKTSKSSKKEKSSRDLLDAVTIGIQQLRRFSKQVKKLSTTQKVVGGLAALAAGYAFLANTSPVEPPIETPALDEPTPPVALSTLILKPQARTPKPRRSKPGSHAKHVPFSQEHS